jgi:hypothetical protein
MDLDREGKENEKRTKGDRWVEMRTRVMQCVILVSFRDVQG